MRGRDVLEQAEEVVDSKCTKLVMDWYGDEHNYRGHYEGTGFYRGFNCPDENCKYRKLVLSFQSYNCCHPNVRPYIGGVNECPKTVEEELVEWLRRGLRRLRERLS